MEHTHITAVYAYLCESTRDPRTFVDQLNRGINRWGDPGSTVLYLPMYSMGLGVGSITPRIEWLSTNGWDVARLARAKDADRDRIAAAVLSNGRRFGMSQRIDELICKARQISEFGIDGLQAVLAPPAEWGCRELLRPVRILQGFQGIGPAAALHILMELGWGVVKPDRHICRFLSRLGQTWSDYFAEPGAMTVKDEARLPLMEAWRDACQLLGARRGDELAPRQDDDAHFPALEELTPRQIDCLIMWYTQDIPREDRSWLPAPICTDDPQCDICGVPGCTSRLGEPPR